MCRQIVLIFLLALLLDGVMQGLCDRYDVWKKEEQSHLGEYIASVKHVCTTMSKNQKEELRTGIPCLSPPYLIDTDSDAKIEHRHHNPIDTSLFPDKHFVYAENPKHKQSSVDFDDNTRQLQGSEEIEYRQFLSTQIYQRVDPELSYSLVMLGRKLNRIEAEMFVMIRLFNNRYFLINEGFGCYYYENLTAPKYFDLMKPLVEEFNNLRTIRVLLERGRESFVSENKSKFHNMITRIDYMNEVMLHNFVIIARMNIYLLVSERWKLFSKARYPEAKKGMDEIVVNIITATGDGLVNTTTYVINHPFETIGSTVLGAVATPFALLYGGGVWANAFGHIVHESTFLVASEQKLYIPPNLKYALLIKRWRRPVRSVATDVLRAPFAIGYKEV